MKRLHAQALARTLDGSLPLGEAPAEARALASLAAALDSSGRVALRPEFRGQLRSSLVEAARTVALEPVPGVLERLRSATSAAGSRARASARLASVTAASALALSGSGVAVAAERSAPGDALYDVKLALEDARLCLELDDLARGQRRLDYAAERLAEAEAAAAAGDMDAVALALHEADETSRAAAEELAAAYEVSSDPEALAAMERFGADQRARLAALQPLLGGAASQAARDLMVAIDRMVALLAVLADCPTCGPHRVQARADQGPSDFAIPPADQPFEPAPGGEPAGPGTSAGSGPGAAPGASAGAGAPPQASGDAPPSEPPADGPAEGEPPAAPADAPPPEQPPPPADAPGPGAPPPADAPPPGAPPPGAPPPAAPPPAPAPPPVVPIPTPPPVSPPPVPPADGNAAPPQAPDSETIGDAIEGVVPGTVPTDPPAASPSPSPPGVDDDVVDDAGQAVDGALDAGGGALGGG